jgi:hypothetical protein
MRLYTPNSVLYVHLVSFDVPGADFGLAIRLISLQRANYIIPRCKPYSLYMRHPSRSRWRTMQVMMFQGFD